MENRCNDCGYLVDANEKENRAIMGDSEYEIWAWNNGYAL